MAGILAVIVLGAAEADLLCRSAGRCTCRANRLAVPVDSAGRPSLAARADAADPPTAHLAWLAA